MADKPNNVELPERGYTTEDVRAVPTKPKRRRGLWALLALVFVPAALFAAWTAITLGYTYSRGERGPGVVQKFSRKGWVCKTWEGELALIPAGIGVPSEPFRFTVRDDSVAAVINQLAQRGERVSLKYDQHRGVPTSCFGETEYFVTGAQPIGAAGAPIVPTTGTVPAAGVPPVPAPVPR